MELKDWLDSDNNTMTVVDFAKKVGVTRNMIYHWCEGRCFPGIEHWDAIQRATCDSVRVPEDFLRKYKEYKMLHKKTIARSKKTT